MKTQPQIAFKGMEPSPFVQKRIEEEIEKLEQFFGRITSCQVTIEAPGHHKKQGGLYSLHLHLSLPDGREVVATRHPPKQQAHEDPYVTIRDSFAAARRQLQDQARKLEGKVKHHEETPIAIVKEIVPERDFGFLLTVDEREIYFHRNSVLNDQFDNLLPGMGVSFSEEEGDKGPRASTVRVLGKHNLF